MPALRERQEDIPLLVDYFTESHSKQHNVVVKKITESSLRALLDYHWPGNIRELSNRIERYVLLNDEEELTKLSFIQNAQSSNIKAQLPDTHFPESGYNWEHFEQYCLVQALEQSQGNRTKAAKYLQMSYKAFLYRLEKYKIN